MKTKKIQDLIAVLTMIIVAIFSLSFLAFMAITQYYRLQEQKIEVENEKLQQEVYQKELQKLDNELKQINN